MRYRNAKVIILGNSDTGKSSLNGVLVGEPFIPELSTQKHHIRLLDRQVQSDKDGHSEVRETLLWDMGWRSGYALIHQLHLNDVAVALIVLDVRSDSDPEAGVREWVRAVKRIKKQRSAEIRMFLVITRKDRGGGGSRLSDKMQHLKEKLGFDDVFETSAKEGWGISELKKAILESIVWETSPIVSSMALMQGMQAFLNDKRQAGEQFLPQYKLYEVFEQLWAATDCQHRDQQKQFALCMRYIEAWGEVRWLSLGRYILLQPELFNVYASRLLDEARDDPVSFGCIDEQRALSGDFLEETVRIQDGAWERILLASILEDFQSNGIAFKDGRGSHTRLIFPSQSIQDSSDSHELAPEYYIIHGEGDIPSFYWTLIVSLAHNKDFVKKNHWPNIVTYTAESGKLCGLSLHMHNETQYDLTVFFESGVSEEIRKLFTAHVYLHLKFYDRNASLSHVLRCPNCETRFPDYQVKSMRDRHKRIITCPVCDRIINLPDESSLTASFTVEPIEHAVAPLLTENIRARKDKDDYDVFFCYNEDEQDKREIAEICDALEKRGIVTWFGEIDLRPGTSRLGEVQRQMRNVKAAVVCFGNEQKNPRWQETQMEALLNQSFKRGCIIIPVLLEHAPEKKPQLPDFFDTRWVDFHHWKPNPIEQLIWGMKGEKP